MRQLLKAARQQAAGDKVALARLDYMDEPNPKGLVKNIRSKDDALM